MLTISKFIITGATGFIGPHLCKRLLQENHEVYIICRKESNLTRLEDILEKITIFTYDSNIENLVAYFQKVNPYCVIHLAAMTSTSHDCNTFGKQIDANFTFATHILEAMRLSSTKKIINTGSRHQHSGENLYHASCLYGALKNSLKSMIDYYVQNYDFEVITLSLFNVYGKGNYLNILSLFEKVAKTQEPLIIKNKDSLMDLIYISDAIEAFICALKLFDSTNFNNNQNYAVCTEKLISVENLITLYEDTNNIKLNIIWDNNSTLNKSKSLPWSKYTMLPGWKDSISLEEGLKK